MGNVIPWKATTDDQPSRLSAHEAQKLIQLIAQESKNVFVVSHGKKRRRHRQISMRQILGCLQRGYVTEGPFVNFHGNWQASVSRFAAGEEVTCVVAIEWKRRLVVVTVF